MDKRPIVIVDGKWLRVPLWDWSATFVYDMPSAVWSVVGTFSEQRPPYAYFTVMGANSAVEIEYIVATAKVDMTDVGRYVYRLETRQQHNSYIGSSLDDFLRDEGIYAVC